MTLKYSLSFLSALLLTIVATTCSVWAVEPVKISSQDTALDLTRAAEIHHTDNNILQVSTAPGPDGIVRRIEVQANSERGATNWAVFSIANPTDEQFDRLIVAPHYRFAGSGLFYPDLGAVRMHSITPSEGFALNRQTSSDSDIFNITINPGAVITFVAELDSANLPQVYLWQPDSYKDTINAYTLYRGILLGISGLLALLLSILFIVRGTALFFATSTVAWAVLSYIGIDFYFFNKLFAIIPESEPLWRAGSEVALAASFFIFIFTYLHLYRWHYRFNYTAIIAVLTVLALAAIAIVSPQLTAGLARLSLGLIAISGVVLIGYLAIHGFDRAIMLIPTWLLVIVWIIGCGACITGYLNNDIVHPALTGGLVLIVLLISFTVLQHAFLSGTFHQNLFSDFERQALAVMGAGDTVWDWDINRDKVTINPDLSKYLGAGTKKLSGEIRNFINAIHNDDRDQFRTALETILETQNGQLEQKFRINTSDRNYHWFALRARPVTGGDGRLVRCVGTIINITNYKKAEERLLYDSVHDNLTHLPNRQLFIDRLQNASNLALIDKQIKPVILVIDFDGFRRINQKYGLSSGDLFLLTIAKRLSRLIQPQDTVSRLEADRFAVILNTIDDSAKVATFVELLQKTVTAPMQFTQGDFQLSASIGLVTWTNRNHNAKDILSDAELAMLHAKRHCGNRIEPYRPNFRSSSLEYQTLQRDLQNALDNNEFNILYHPVLNLDGGHIVGFEAFTVWNHPQYGELSALDLVSAAEHSNFIMPLCKFSLKKVANDLSYLQDKFPHDDFFISVNLPSAEMVCQDFITEVRSFLLHYSFKPERLMFELPEIVFMSNPEQSAVFLDKIKSLGFLLALDNFGTGYSSLSYLVRYPFDLIKLDRTLLSNDKQKKKIILQAIVNVAHDFNLKVIADGVEIEADAILLRELGCEYVQSVVFTEPVGIEGVKNLIEQHHNTDK